MGHRTLASALAALALLLAVPATTVSAATRVCDEPGATWSTATPQQSGLDKGELDLALHAYQDRRGYAVRIYRHGCLVSQDTVLGSETTRHESWEITSSVLALVALRQMQQGRLHLDDPVGSLVPEADAAHGAITVRALLERTSGMASHSDNVYREHVLLTALSQPVRRPGARLFGDAPSARDLLVTVLERATGEDLQTYAARELFGPVGIRGFSWARDRRGHTRGSFGLRLTADELGRLAELVRREGVWRGRRLLRASDVAAMLVPAGDPCHGWMTWLNDGRDCVRSDRRLLPGLPADLWSWRGRYDQRVVVLPELGLVVVRYGASGGDQRAADDQATWERDVLLRLVGAVRDVTPARTAGTKAAPPDTDSRWTDDASAAAADAPTPPGASPVRTRAPRIAPGRTIAGRARLVSIEIGCPDVGGIPCRGTVSLQGVQARSKTWTVPRGETRTVLLRLKRRPRTPIDVTFVVQAQDEDAGIRVTEPATLRR